MELLASGRDADVHLLGGGRVLRRYRDGRPAAREAEVMRALVAAGYSAPRVWGVDGPDLVLSRIHGPTLAEAMATGSVSVAGAAGLLARLHDDLHDLPWPGGAPLLHLDLHPLNVMMPSEGPVVIDWSNARPGPAALDVATTALIVAQVVVTPGMLPDQPELEAALRHDLGAFLPAFATAVTTPWKDHLEEAAARRALDPNLTARELALLGDAAALARAAASRPRG
ncbi:phosphotransferase [Antribacter sp. KLBMP9083]|uniref:Phosphotransferase n=1 Tax=Antribacter soli TaxID=2910976 RepID=A0AA41UAB8_9MICO|nr:phosphotransferase [Antribacter soli]MCF4122477.1 phosphotransferase [Antribacter soli]